jgi:hypothetical protein
METFSLKSKSSWNFHKLEVSSKDDSLSIEVFPKKCSHNLRLFVRKDVQPTFEKFEWNKTIRPSNSTHNSSGACSYTDNKAALFISNKVLTEGVYFVGVTMNDTELSSNLSMEYFMRVYVSKCLFWNMEVEKWKGDGCWVSKKC